MTPEYLPECSGWHWATSGPMTVIVRAVEREGLQVSDDDGHTWRQSGRGFGDDTVTALGQAGDGALLYVATANHGVYVSRDIGRHWRSANTGLPTLSISCLLATTAGGDRLFVGTSSGGVFVLFPGETRWLRMNQGLSSLGGQTLTVGTDPGVLYCAMDSMVYKCRIL